MPAVARRRSHQTRHGTVLEDRARRDCAVCGMEPGGTTIRFRPRRMTIARRPGCLGHAGAGMDGPGRVKGFFRPGLLKLIVAVVEQPAGATDALHTTSRLQQRTFRGLLTSRSAPGLQDRSVRKPEARDRGLDSRASPFPVEARTREDCRGAVLLLPLSGLHHPRWTTGSRLLLRGGGGGTAYEGRRDAA